MISTEKAEARTLAQERRKGAYDSPNAVDAANAALLSLINETVGPVSGYLPIRTEMDPLPTLTKLDRQIGVPVITGRGMPLTFAQWTSAATLVKGDFGVMIPDPIIPVTPMVLIVPLLAFDRQGYRLGYGGGFYDRTIAALDNVTSIGFAYAAQECATVPREDTDERLDYIVTEKEILRF